MVIKRFQALLSKKPSQDNVSSNQDDPEAHAAKGVRQFCESAAANSGDEVLYLPALVENAVASPQAAGAAATQIRKFIAKEGNRPHIQYNAIMLIRILADNPGPSFTKHIDNKFVEVVRTQLRTGRDPSVQQLLRETIDALERDKAYDTNLNLLFNMWRKELSGIPPPIIGRNDTFRAGSSSHPRESRRPRTLPSQTELAGRIEEARTSAKLLLQLVQSTPQHEIFTNDLIKEFSERCMSAHKSIQGYINCDNPAPDDDTMLTLIETAEQLSLAASKHQRAVLQARRALGLSPPAPTGQEPQYFAPPAAATATATSPSPPAPQSLSYLPAEEQKDLPQIPPVRSTGSLSTQTPPHQQPNSTVPSSLQAGQQQQQQQPTDSTARGPSPTIDPFGDDQAYAAPPANHPPPAAARPYDTSPVTDYTEPYHPGYRAPADADRTTGPIGLANGEVSPIDTRAPATSGQMYRY